MTVVHGDSFDAIASAWRNYHVAVFGAKWDDTQLDEFEGKKPESEKVLSALEPVISDCLRLIKGNRPIFTPANPATANLLCFFPKLLNVGSIDDIPPSARDHMSDAIEETFMLGLAGHLILFNHPARPRLAAVNNASLFNRWSEGAAIADVELKVYDRECDGVPGDMFERIFRRRLDPFLKQSLRIGFWRRVSFNLTSGMSFSLALFSACSAT